VAAPTALSCVVDTNIVSYMFKNNSLAQLYRRHLTGRVMIISFMSVAELDYWALRRNWGIVRAESLRNYIERFTLYPFDRDLCRIWAEITDAERRQGRIISTSEAWIAATALINDIPLVTHNRRHFEGIAGLTVISEN
jgi:tRNA(fMet)-specific endonuclease VapC